MAKTKKTRQMVMVGVWANRNWILGNWIKEVKLRLPNNFRLWWVPSIYAGKRPIEKFLKFPIPTADAYFFSYPTIFKYYEQKNSAKFKNNSIVLYPHNEPEMGSIKEQVAILNKAFKVHFYCSSDAKVLVENGLSQSKVVVAYCAIDVDCISDFKTVRDDKTIVLASRYGPRKGAQLLPQIIKKLPDWKFTLMGRGWENFIKENKIEEFPNFHYVQFNKNNRSKYFSSAKVFLSLSSLEGGPVPLIETMSLGVFPICTETGFAPDFIEDSINGYLLPINPSADLVVSKINNIDKLSQDPSLSVKHLTWDRITALTYADLEAIS